MIPSRLKLLCNCKKRGLPQMLSFSRCVAQRETQRFEMRLQWARRGSSGASKAVRLDDPAFEGSDALGLPAFWQPQ